MPRELGIYDEGIILLDAMRVLHGDIPHRDFYANYGPAQYYAVASIFSVFGKSFISARIYDVLLRSITVSIFYIIVNRYCRFSISLVATGVAGLWLLSSATYLYPVFPCLLFALLGSYLVARFGEGKSGVFALAAAGACTGLTALFRYETGFFLLLAHMIALMLTSLSRERRDRLRGLVAAVGAYGVGTALIFVPAAVAFLFVSPPAPFLADIIGYPTKYYALMRGLPFPGPSALRETPQDAAVYLPFLAVGLALFALLRPGGETPRPSRAFFARDRATIYLVVFGGVAAMFLLKGIVRVSAIHMLLSIVPSLIVFAILAERLWRRGHWAKAAAAFLMLVALAPAVFSAKQWFGQSIHTPDRTLAGWMAVRAGLVRLSPTAAGRCESGPASGVAMLPEDYARVANYLAAHTAADEPIMVGLDRHDKIFVNPVALYFASGRLSSTHWHQFDPGLQTRADVQADIVHELASRHVRWVVRDSSFEVVNEPNGSSKSSGVVLLDRYLAAHYRPVAASGKIAIWLVNGEPAPRGATRPAKCEAAPLESQAFADAAESNRGAG